jgi:hypothetical protein
MAPGLPGAHVILEAFDGSRGRAIADRAALSGVSNTSPTCHGRHGEITPIER